MIPAGWAVLETVAASPVLQAAFGGGANAAWVADLDAGRIRPEPSARWVQPEPETAEHAIARYLAEALARCEAWTAWHSARADLRGLTTAPGYLRRAARTLGLVRVAVEARGITASSGWVPSVVYRDALAVAEWEFTDRGFRINPRRQLDEIETSHLRTLALITIRGIVDCHRRMKNGDLSATDAQIAAAELLAYAPGWPMDTE